MALTWDLSKIRNHEETCWIGEGDNARMNPVTEALIFGTMGVGLGSITSKNVDEFAARFRVVEKLSGPLLCRGKDPWYLSDDDFIAHIGLATNVTNETRARWVARTFTGKHGRIEDYARAFRHDRARNVKAAR